MRGRVADAKTVGRVLESEELCNPKWVVDYVTPEKVVLHPLEKSPISVQTEFQRADILHTKRFGRVLMLDGVIQLAEADEYIYHELLVHPVLSRKKGARKSILVLGGGDGCLAREACRYDDVEEVVVVDLDSELVDMCMEHMADINDRSFDDPRVKLITTDALEYLRKTDRKFDVVYSDLTDPDLEGPAEDLYARQTFGLVKDRLADDGVFVIQSCAIAYHSNDHYMLDIGRDLEAVFEAAVPYGDYVPSFDGIWCFWLAGDKTIIDRCVDQDPVDLPASLRFYNAATHRRAFLLRGVLGEDG